MCFSKVGWLTISLEASGKNKLGIAIGSSRFASVCFCRYGDTRYASRAPFCIRYSRHVFGSAFGTDHGTGKRSPLGLKGDVLLCSSTA